MNKLDTLLLWVIRSGVFLLLFTPLVVTQSLFFPFITGKNFFFRIIVEIIFSAWLILALVEPNFRPRRSPVLLAFGLFIGIMAVATIFGADPYHSFWSNFERMEGFVTHIHLLALFFVLAHSIRRDIEWFYFYNISIGVSCVVALYALLQVVGLIKLIGAGRPYATLGNSIYLAVYLMFHLFITGALFTRVRSLGIRIVYGLIFLLELYVSFVAASRGAFVGFSIGVVFVALAMLFIISSRPYRLSGFAVIFLLGALFAFIVFNPAHPFIQRSDLLSRLASISGGTIRQDPRVLIWGMAKDAIFERPILGWGPENFIIPYAKYYNPSLYGNEAWFDRAHNMLLEWLVATGVIGFLGYIGIFFAAGHVILKLVQRKVFDCLLAIIVSGVFIAYIVQNIFVFDNIVTYIMIVLILSTLHSFYISRDRVRTLSNMHKQIQPMHLVASAGITIATLILVYVINVRPILASHQLITALKSLNGENTPEYVIGEFDKVIAYNTFGTTEARERIADVLVQVALKVERGSPGLDLVLQKSIQEINKEIAAQPHVAKYPIFLGKLFAIQTNWTGTGAELAEKSYVRARELAPRYVQINLGLAELYLITRQNKKAIEEADDAFALAPRSASMFYAVISTHLLADDASGARNILLKFVAENEFKPDSTNFGKEEIELIIQRSNVVKKPEDRILFLDEFIRWSAPTARTHIVTAQSYGDIGRKSEARYHALKAAEIDPSRSEEVEKFIKSLEALP